MVDNYTKIYGQRGPHKSSSTNMYTFFKALYFILSSSQFAGSLLR